MGFMQKESEYGPYWEIETDRGTYFLPSFVDNPLSAFDILAGGRILTGSATVDKPDDDATEEATEAWADLIQTLGQYTEGGAESIQEVTYHTSGTLYRMSAPGYLDCTDWTPDDDSPEFDID